LIEAILLIERDADLPVVLQDIVQAAVDLAGARYAALGVLDVEGSGLAEFLTVGITPAQREVIGALPRGRGVLGLLIRDPAPIRLKDLSTHPDSVGFPPGHPPMRSFLGVPIRVRGETFGNLYLCDKLGGVEFTEEDEDVVTTLGVAAGLVIDKARLHARLRELTLSEERERLARDLHDRVIQRLFAVGLGLQATLRTVPSVDQRDRLQIAIDELDETIREIRTTIFAVERPRFDEGPGVRSEVLAVVDEAARLGLDVRIDFAGPIDTAVGRVAAEHLVVSLREALSNVIRHAKASHAFVAVEVDSGVLVLTVTDDGVGINPEEIAYGRGLLNLDERARLLGGGSQARSRDEGGTLLVWRATRLD
jgi:signal transduction histidine kinase